MGTWRQFNPVEIVAGSGEIENIARHVPAGKVLVVTSPGFTRRGMMTRLQELLDGPTVRYDRVDPNPDLDTLETAANSLRGSGITSVLALGGGSAIDTGKAFCSALASEQPDFLAGTLRRTDRQLPPACLPLIAIPTTAGTGAEVTPFATIWDRPHQLKRSLAGRQLFPRVAVLDPQLTLSLPPRETLYSGLDCLSHALESLWNRHRTPVSAALAVRSLSIAEHALPRVMKDPSDIAAREEMQNASTVAGLAISQNRTALAHSISYPLTSHFSVPHGLAVGFTLRAIIHQILNQHALDEVNDVERLLASIDRLLGTLNLGKEIRQFTSADQAIEKIGEMLTSERSNNFVLIPDPAMIRALIEQSFELSEDSIDQRG